MDDQYQFPNRRDKSRNSVRMATRSRRNYNGTGTYTRRSWFVFLLFLRLSFCTYKCTLRGQGFVREAAKTHLSMRVSYAKQSPTEINTVCMLVCCLASSSVVFTQGHRRALKNSTSSITMKITGRHGTCLLSCSRTLPDMPDRSKRQEGPEVRPREARCGNGDRDVGPNFR